MSKANPRCRLRWIEVFWVRWRIPRYRARRRRIPCIRRSEFCGLARRNRSGGLRKNLDLRERAVFFLERPQGRTFQSRSFRRLRCGASWWCYRNPLFRKAVALLALRDVSTLVAGRSGSRLQDSFFATVFDPLVTYHVQLRPITTTDRYPLL